MTEILRRRRIMMAKKSGQLISSLAAGDVVKINENGSYVDFVFIGINTQNHAIVLRATNLTTQIAFNAQASKPEYANSQIDQWLQNTVLPYYSTISNYIVANNITYANYDDSFVESIVTISRKIYIPSYYEMGAGGNEGGMNFLPALKTYKDTTNENTARSTGANLWLRTELSYSGTENRVRIVSNTGAFNYQQSNSTSPKARPVLSLSAKTPTSTVGADIYIG